jgi:predicted aconitase with swiveling domain
MELGERISGHRLWLFTSAHVHELASADGTVAILEEAGALVLKDTCPEVTPYNRQRYNHLLTNSLKAEHYLTSGLNRIPTSVARLDDCVAHAFDASLASGGPVKAEQVHQPTSISSKTYRDGELNLRGKGLLSQKAWRVKGKALVSDIPLTFLGYLHKDTGVVEDVSHPLDGKALQNRILIFPKGSGSTVAPYVLMGLLYTGFGPLAVVNRDVCPLTLPACSLLSLPYAHAFDKDPCMEVNDGDEVELVLADGQVTLTVISRVSSNVAR